MTPASKAARTAWQVGRAALAWNRYLLKLTRLTHGRLLPRAPTLLVASTPKSGSTFLAACMREATGYRGALLADRVMSDQDLSEARLLDALPVPVVVHQHCTATQATVELLRRYDLAVLFQFRRLDDTLVSIRDKLDTDPWLGQTFYANAAFRALDEPARMDAIVALTAPRFIRQYASWRTAIASGQVRGAVMAYEDIMADKAGALMEALGVFGRRIGRERAEAAVAAVEARGGTRLNRGVAGRGRAALTPAHHAFLETLTAPYPWVDFSPIGLRGPVDADAVLSDPLPARV